MNDDARDKVEPMMGFRVIDLSVDGRLAMLLDDEEFTHVVRFAGRGPEHGALLTGRRAKLGAHILVVGHPGVAMHARFESVACSQDEALILMHPGPAGAPVRSPDLGACATLPA